MWTCSGTSPARLFFPLTTLTGPDFCLAGLVPLSCGDLSFFFFVFVWGFCASRPPESGVVEEEVGEQVGAAGARRGGWGGGVTVYDSILCCETLFVVCFSSAQKPKSSYGARGVRARGEREREGGGGKGGGGRERGGGGFKEW